jgi:hypothetical protein
MKSYDDLTDDALATIESALEQRGMSTALVKDGYVLVFTSGKLEELLSKSRESGRAVIFIQDVRAATAALASCAEAEKNVS